MKKPGLFTLTDLLFGFGSFGTLGLFIYLLTSGVTQLQILSMMGLIVVLFCGFWAFMLVQRYNWLKTFSWYPEYNLMIQWDKYVGCPEIVGYTDQVIQCWKAYFPNAADVLKSKVNWVSFQTDLHDLTTGVKCLGYMITTTHTAVIQYVNPNDKIEDLAYAHEFGHIIYGNATNTWNSDEQHAFFAKHNLGRILFDK